MKFDGTAGQVRFGPYRADFKTQELWKEGIRLKLARQPFEILELLVAQPGQLVSREELQKRLWAEGHFVDASHGLNAAVNKLREALCDSAENPKYIETLPRRGYRFIGEIVTEFNRLEKAELSPEADQPVTQGKLDTGTLPLPIAQTAAIVPPAAQRRWPIWLAASVSLVLGGFIGLALNLERSNSRQAEALEKERAEFKDADRLSSPQQTGRPGRTNSADSRSTSEPAAAMTRDDVTQQTENLAVRIDPEPRSPTLSPAEVQTETVQAGKLPVTLAEPEAYAELRPAEFRTIISGAGGNAAPQISPDGRRIAFMSNRSGSWQIWMSNADGSDPVRVSFTDSAGTPRWSPDGKSFVFDAPWDGTTFVFLAPVNEPHNARPIAEGYVPSFSRDGKFVYFASDRTGHFEVWKVAVSGGPEIQLTRQGGFAALESKDGNIYYSKSRYPNPELWRMPVTGGKEAVVSPMLRPRTWASWTVTKDGILLVADLPDRRSHLTLYNPDKETVRDLTSLETSPFWMAASEDGRKVVMNDSAEQQITMVSNLR